MKQTVVVLEDDPDISRLVGYHLDRVGFKIRLYDRIGQIVQEAERSPPALFLLDIMVPGGDGFELCRFLQSHPFLSGVPIIILTARGGEEDRVKGLEMGAEDYIVKPFSIRELVARVKIVLRRFERNEIESAPGQLTIGNITMDRAAMQVYVNELLVPMTATEFRLLEYLMERPGRVFTRDQLIEAVWSGDRFVTDRSVDVYIGRLREKIEASPASPEYLVTVRGTGYRFGRSGDKSNNSIVSAL